MDIRNTSGSGITKLQFYCNFEYRTTLIVGTEPKITINVNMRSLHSVLKNMNDGKSIAMYINKDNRNVLHIREIDTSRYYFKSFSFVKDWTNMMGCDGINDTKIHVGLIDNFEFIFSYPGIYQRRIAIASDIFFAKCRTLNNKSTLIELKSISNKFLLEGLGKDGKIIEFYETVDRYNKDTQPIIKGPYNIEDMLMFIKYYRSGDTMGICIDNDHPLVLDISVGYLGKLFVFIAQIDINN
jgi:hypothetical protein